MKPVSIRKSKIAGRGLFADHPIVAGKTILSINGPIIKKVITSLKESRAIENWIGVGKDLWVNTDNSFIRFINHSCYPNAAMTGKRRLVALQNIAKDDEITIDYSMTDADPYWRIKCKCGHKQCRKEIRAIYTVTQEVFLRHFTYVSKPFQKLFIRNYIISKDSNKPKET